VEIVKLKEKTSSQTTKIGVVDYGRGNLRSVGKALEAAGARVEMLTDPSRFDAVDAVVVPGVGSFGDCAGSLKNSGMWDALQEWLRTDRPYLGICLGYQLLFETSEESPEARGLGYLPGRVVRFPVTDLKIPHMGWNTLSAATGPLYQGEVGTGAFYFVHSYYPVPAEAGLTSAICEYGVPFAASISWGAVHATQFHPEKSQAGGLALLENFIKTVSDPESKGSLNKTSHAAPAGH
jgi:imidazole glycerol-phosphate synthase subunit HisH